MNGAYIGMLWIVDVVKFEFKLVLGPLQGVMNNDCTLELLSLSLLLFLSKAVLRLLDCEEVFFEFVFRL